MKVLITGPTGPAGQYLLEQMLTTDRSVRVLALPETLHRVPYRNRIEIVPGSLEHAESLRRAVDGVDLVYHAATISPPPPRDPGEMMSVNAEGTRRLLEACAGDIRRFVFVSGVVVFTPHRTPDTWPVRAEAARQAHGNPQLTALGQSLIDAEDYVFQAHQRYGMEYCILRPTVICGRSARFAEQLVGELLRSPDRAEVLDRMWGTMQWVHGGDFARAAVSAGDHAAAKNETFIVAGAEPITTLDVLSTLWEITNPNLSDNPYRSAAQNKNPGIHKFDVEKISEALGFSPEISIRQCLEELLARIEFFTSASLEFPQSTASAQA